MSNRCLGHSQYRKSTPILNRMRGPCIHAAECSHVELKLPVIVRGISINFTEISVSRQVQWMITRYRLAISSLQMLDRVSQRITYLLRKATARSRCMRLTARSAS